MKTIKKDEIYKSLDGFLKSKGIKLSNGAYSKAVRKACGYLTEAVHLAQEGVNKTRVTVDSSLDKLRKTIHEATAPNTKKASKPSAAKKSVPKKVVKKKATKEATPKKSTPAKAVNKTPPARKKTDRSPRGIKTK